MVLLNRLEKESHAACLIKDIITSFPIFGNRFQEAEVDFFAETGYNKPDIMMP